MKLKYQYHSCRNRHCPACGSMQKEQWVDDRRSELLPISYYHIVFTLPHELNSIILGNRKVLYKLLFDATAETLLDFAKNPKHLGAIPGILAVLHTWGQQLSFHPHLHCIVSGGGMIKTKDGMIWKNAVRNKDDFLFPVKAMAIVFRAKYLHGLKKLIANQDVTVPFHLDIQEFISPLYSKDWVVYAKKPFGGPQQVIEYLGRYTHKVAITNNRIKAAKVKVLGM
ncbi:MAG: transposase [Saprospiraceae bacterium]|nr:transposase [Saprospiraceae bacterium]